MAEIDYGKVEKLFHEGVAQMEKDSLLYMAEMANSFGMGFDEIPQMRLSKEQKERYRELESQTLRHDLMEINKNQKGLLKKMGVKRELIERFLRTPQEITDKEFAQMKEIHKQLRAFRAELKKTLAQPSSESQIESGLKKAKNSRFNVQDDWLPLH